jgi:hypothetical protein
MRSTSCGTFGVFYELLVVGVEVGTWLNLREVRRTSECLAAMAKIWFTTAIGRVHPAVGVIL